MGKGVGGRGEGDAEDDEEDVGHGQVEDQEVSRVPHLFVEAHHEDNLRIFFRIHYEIIFNL